MAAHTVCQVVDCLADLSPTLTSCNIAKLAPKSAAYTVVFSANCAEGTCVSAARWRVLASVQPDGGQCCHSAATMLKIFQTIWCNDNCE